MRYMEVVLAACLMAQGCGGSPKTLPRWRNESVALKVNGFVIGDSKAVRTEWFGSGIVVGPGRVVTNAHVALRGLEILATDDDANVFELDRLIAVDVENDLALLGSERISGSTAALASRPESPKDLRGTPIVAVGNTGGQGLSVYQGHVTNFIAANRHEVIVHDAQVSSGSSGGPLYDEARERVLGVNTAISFGLRQSMAIPAWVVTDFVQANSANKGVALHDVYRVDDPPLELRGEKRLCLQEGESVELDVPAENVVDLVFAIAPLDAEQTYDWGLFTAEGPVREPARTRGNTRHLFSVQTPGTQRLIVGNPGEAEFCVAMAAGRVKWEERL